MIPSQLAFGGYLGADVQMRFIQPDLFLAGTLYYRRANETTPQSLAVNGTGTVIIPSSTLLAGERYSCWVLSTLTGGGVDVTQPITFTYQYAGTSGANGEFIRLGWQVDSRLWKTRDYAPAVTHLRTPVNDSGYGIYWRLLAVVPGKRFILQDTAVHARLRGAKEMSVE